MFNKLKIKRGNIANLPRLNIGEPAFTLDTKNFYIGGNSKNINLTPIHRNLLLNSNFQVNLETSDISAGNKTLTGGSGRYIFGNYYLENISTTSFTYTVPTATNKLLGINPVATATFMPSISYYTKLPNGNFTPIENNMVTLSFDTVSSETIDFISGVPGNTVSSTIPIGTKRNSVSFIYTSTTLSGRPAPSMNFILFKVNSNLTKSLSIGNFKIELGNYATTYSPNSLAYDVAMLKQSYMVMRDVKRASFCTGSQINIYYNLRETIMNMNPKIIVNTAIIYSIGGGVAVNPANVTYDTTYNAINCYYATSYLDASGFIVITIDNRV